MRNRVGLVITFAALLAQAIQASPARSQPDPCSLNPVYASDLPATVDLRTCDITSSVIVDESVALGVPPIGQVFVAHALGRLGSDSLAIARLDETQVRLFGVGEVDRVPREVGEFPWEVGGEPPVGGSREIGGRFAGGRRSHRDPRAIHTAFPPASFLAISNPIDSLSSSSSASGSTRSAGSSRPPDTRRATPHIQMGSRGRRFTGFPCRSGAFPCRSPALSCWE
jgi:hypothetical protein